VDTFHEFDKAVLLKEFKYETFTAIGRGISLNPILQSFQETVNEYGITYDLIRSFFTSMEMDLDRSSYNQSGYNKYIYGSAEVVGLMCLHVFCDGNEEQYYQLKPYARSLGAAFQKVNFLRDMQADYNELKRIYFPGCDFSNFSSQDKLQIEEDIQRDFDQAFKGILQLPLKARFGVYVAYKYYLSLFKKIKKLKPKLILEQRIRIPGYGKAMILAKASVRSKLNIL
jgi:phytoene/squalene synthetase